MAVKGYIADLKMDAVLLFGAYIDDLQFAFIDSSGVPLDFTALGATGYEMRIYTTRNNKRELLVTLTDATELSESGGTITWDADFPATVITFPSTYYHEIDYIDVEGNKRIGQGKIKVI